MLEVYCDESVADMFGKPLLFLSAYMATEDRWRAFDIAWKTEILQAYSIPYLHAVDLRNTKTSIYRHLSIEARRGLLSAACTVIGTHVDAGFGTYMRPADLEALTTPHERTRWGGAYGICTELLLSLISAHLKRPDRINIFYEAGHANSGSALKKIENYKHDSEPVEWPELVGGEINDNDETFEREMRRSAVRIGKYGLVSKEDSSPTQAADLFAYLAATTFRNDTDPVFSACFDNLVNLKLHALSPWGPKALQELVEGVRATAARWKKEREDLYTLRKTLHARGIKSYALPWGLVLDKGPHDEFSSRLHDQVKAIRKNLSGD